jgi:hypothetical protein
MRKIITLLVILLVFVGVTKAQDLVLEGNISTNVALQSGKTYLMKGFVRIQDGASLTIPAGTIIYGDYNSQGSLIVLPGGKIYAEGTMENPIVFTSQFTKEGSTQSPNYGDWGGIIILGKAPINVPGGTAKIEGPGDYYGGTDPEDNSGVMKYVRIEYPGIAFSPNNEINGLTFGGVGRGTVIDYVQVSYSGDDSFEWFGGTVNAKHLIAYRGWDDDFDTDFGFSGKLQYLLGVRDPQIADQSQSNGFESDNDGSGSLNNPRTSPTWWNVTLVGPAKDAATQFNSLYRRGMHLRRSSQNKINNTIILGWPTGLYIDGTNTVADAKANVSYLKNSIVAGSVTKQLSSTDTDFEAGMAAWFGANNGKLLATTAELYLADPFNIENPNPMPIPPVSPAFIGGATPPNDGFFDTNANFIGAFGREDWTAGWSSLKLEIPTSVKEEFENEIPSSFELSQNYPNPFNPSTSIKFSLPNAGMVKLSIYNVLGQEVANLVNSYKESGNYIINWNAGNLSSGMYIYRLETGSQIITKKMTLLK